MVLIGNTPFPCNFGNVMTQSTFQPNALTKDDLMILKFLGEENGGWQTREVSRQCQEIYLDLPSNARSREFGKMLRRLMKLGLVKHLDDEKPICWVRTKAGTKAIL